MANLEDYKKRLEDSLDMFCGGVRKVAKITNGDLISIQDWINQCKNGGFIDYDGHGNLAVQLPDNTWIIGKPNIYPSDITKLNLTLPTWTSHVLWFNR